MRTKTKYKNIYYDDVRKKYEYQKMINGSRIFGRANTLDEAYKLLIEEEARNNDTKQKKKIIYPTINICINKYIDFIGNNIKSTYKQHLIQEMNLHIKNKFRDVPINELTDNDFKKYYKYLLKRKILASTKNKYLNNLKKLFEFINIMYSYDCIFVKRLQSFKDYSIDEDIKEIKIITFDDLKKIYNSLNDSYQQLLLLTLFLLGGRAGEILALNPSSFDLDNNCIKIKYSATWKSDKKGFTLIQTKTPKSKRIYPMPEFYKQKYLEHINKYNIPNKRKYIFFSNINNKIPMCSSSLNRIVSSWSNIVGYRIYPHLFRHTTASLLNANGISVDVIKNYLGHSSTEITEKVYIHETKEKQEAINYLTETFLSNLDEK